jgi:hypothetical protein
MRPALIVIQTSVDSKGRSSARCGERTTGSVSAMARLLVGEGVEDQPWESYTSTGTRSLFGPSFYRVATIIASESDTRPLRWRKFAPNPFAEVPPLLAKLLAASKQPILADRERAPAPCGVVPAITVPPPSPEPLVSAGAL